MTEVIRGIVKGRIAGTVQTRNMFTGNVTLLGTDSYTDMAYGYITPIYTPLLPYISSVWSSESLQVQKFFGGSWVDLEEVPIFLTATGSTDPLPNTVAAVLIGKTGIKRQLGRKFFAAFTEASSVGNTLVSGAAGAMATALAAYITVWTSAQGSSWAPGVLGKDGQFRLFLGGFVSGLLGTMRRRKPGIGI